MTESEFLKKMKEDILDTESNISLGESLKNIEEWDSLSFVSFIAMSKEYGFTRVNRDSVSRSVTVGDLFELTKCGDYEHGASNL